MSDELAIMDTGAGIKTDVNLSGALTAADVDMATAVGLGEMEDPTPLIPQDPPEEIARTDFTQDLVI